jgi:hypothetical protein
MPMRGARFLPFSTRSCLPVLTSKQMAVEVAPRCTCTYSLCYFVLMRLMLVTGADFRLEEKGKQITGADFAPRAYGSK